MEKLTLLLALFALPHLALASSMVQDINKYRVENNLPEVSELPMICVLGDLRLQQIKTDWSHAGFFAMTKSLKNTGVWFENLAREGTEIVGKNGVLAAWKNSPSHNANLLSKMQFVCIRHQGKYWVMIGLRPASK